MAQLSVIPKLKVPLRMGDGGLAVVDQDSPEEVAASVYALLSTERGSRLGDPDYGVEEAGFEVFPPEEAIDEWMVQIERYEPRARVRTIAELEGLLARLSIRVGVQS
jgi:phage baseplate assembly protein W